MEDAKGRMIGLGSKILIVVPEKRYYGMVVSIMSPRSVLVRLDDPHCATMVTTDQVYKLKKEQ